MTVLSFGGLFFLLLCATQLPAGVESFSLYSGNSTSSWGPSALFNGIADMSHSFVNGITTGTQALANGIVKGTSAVANGIVDTTAAVANGVVAGTSAVANGIAQGTSAAASGIASGTSAVASGIASGTTAVASGIASGTSAVANGILIGTSSALGTVNGYLSVNTPETPLPSPTKTVTISLDDAHHFAELASVAHCDGYGLEDWTCTICNASKPNIELVGVFENPYQLTLKFIVVDHARKEIVDVSRGTRNIKNVMTDLKVIKIASPYDDGVQLHRGFYDAVFSLHQQTIPVLKQMIIEYPDYSIIQTGHSLGGAMAAISYYMLRHDDDLKDKCTTLVTFGEPRPGNIALADFINSQEGLIIGRFVNEGDPVPHMLPYNIGYVHHLTELWAHNGETKICRTDVYEDPACSNSLYLVQHIISDHFNLMGVDSDIEKCYS